MHLIKEIVQQALTSGCLTIAAQSQIRLLLQTNYDSEDIDALVILQRSVECGEVKQEKSHSQKTYVLPKNKTASSNIKLAYQIAAEMAFAAALALTMPQKPQDQPS
ncbi:hypothetical protein VB711_07580 [Cronbergia sp. UHCC 0137]|uniref:hypothetical protein n=1 Tax=Cronbergia sp. UHCC 0137 TaxID=3110239 RepID=UPI002B1FDF44|nr:hypothetical protein [Cronbergia sp. UHCC 0137]MEA5617696.1 hypothetical protein [Cronbergia sp. UHCC 0137]